MNTYEYTYEFCFMVALVSFVIVLPDLVGRKLGSLETNQRALAVAPHW